MTLEQFNKTVTDAMLECLMYAPIAPVRLPYNDPRIALCSKLVDMGLMRIDDNEFVVSQYGADCRNNYTTKLTYGE